MSFLKYRVFNTSLQVDAFIGLDTNGTSVYDSFVSLEKDLPPFCYGCYHGKEEISNFAHKIKKKFSEELNGKRILFVRSIDRSLYKEYSGEIIIKKAIDDFEILKNIFTSSKCYFLLAMSEPCRPLLPENMFYAHIKVIGDGKPNEFKRVLMSRIGRLIQNQKNTGLKPLSSRIFNATNKLIDSITNIKIDYNKEVIYTIFCQGVPFEIFCNFKKKSSILVVFGQSALNQDVVKLPAFRRWSWTRDIPYSCIVLNDPTLYLDKSLEAGWFIGEKDHYYAETASTIISTIANKLNIPLTNTIFMGASAGGYTSMAIASFLKGSSCVVDVPQTNLLTYMHKKEVDKIVNFGFNGQTLSNMDNKYLYRFVLSKLFEKNDYLPNIFYLQNSNDFTAGHLVAQFGEFITSICHLMHKYKHFRQQKMTFKTYDRYHLVRGGHFPLSKTDTIHYLKCAVKEFIDKEET